AAVREHEAAVRQAREEGAASVAKAVMPLLLPASWPPTPGFDSAPLRWRSASPDVAVYAVSAGPERLAMLLIEHGGGIEESIGPPVRASSAGPRHLDAASARELLRAVAAADPSCSATAIRWEGDRLELAARLSPVPHVLRSGRPVPFEVGEDDGIG